MTIFFTQYLELLKRAVLTTSGLKNITPCDCKVISVQIFRKTKFSVSETTLKRVYGFALTKFKPSAFTIDVLAKYCGYDSWDNFCDQQGTLREKPTPASASWDTLKQSAGKITGFTLQALKNKSGIPYAQTIKRQFVDDHLNEFLRADYTATVFAAPAGYGKTIGLCHWVEDRLRLNTLGKADDIILFFSGSALMNVFLSGRNLNDWILALLGYSADEDIRSLMDMQQNKPGSFYLVIDNLDEHIYKPEQFKLLLNQLIDIFSLYQSAQWFKMIVTMRASTWINNRHHVQEGTANWHCGLMDQQTAINVPLLSIGEIKEICLKINPDVKNFLALEIANSFNHPLYFQFYYKQHKQDFSLSKIDHLCIYDLISAFILNKVYLGHYSAEKVLLINALVDAMDIEQSDFDIPKTKVNGLLRQYSQAYAELVSVGFLRELNTSTDFNYQTVIQFVNSNFLEYTLAKALLTANGNGFDEGLINIINYRFANSAHKLNILKWCIIYAIKTSQQKSFELLAQTNLSPAERSDLVIFLGELLEKTSGAAEKSESLVQYFKQDCSTELFNYFFGLELINPYYKLTLHTLLKFNLSNRKRIVVYTALAISAIMQLNLAELETNIQKLKSFPAEDYSSFPLNPLLALETIYCYFKENVIKKVFLIEATAFCFNPPEDNRYFRHIAINDLVYLLSANALMLGGNHHKVLRFINIIKRSYKEADSNLLSGFNFFLSIVEADMYYQLGNTNELMSIYNSLSANYKTNKSAFTGYMKAMYYSLRVKIHLSQGNYQHLLEDTKTFMQMASGSKLSKLFVLSRITNSPGVADMYPQFYKQTQYDLSKLLRECNLSAALVQPLLPQV